MQKHSFRGWGGGSYIAALAVVLVLAAAAWFGYVQVMKWHEKELRQAAADEEKAEEKAETSSRSMPVSLDRQEREKEEQTGDAQSGAAAEKIRQVFGETAAGDGSKTMEPVSAPDCFLLEKQIDSFFSYLDRQGYVSAASVEAEGARAVFEQMLAAAAENPPLVIGETRDIVSLMHNQAHFFRIFNKKRIELVKYILSADTDVLEHAMRNFYAYYVEKGGCGKKQAEAASLDTFYEYACYFLNTFAGKSYLMRRNSDIRSLVRYYSVRILDEANKETINSYGIDIQPHIRLAIDDVRHQNSLLYQEVYLEKLSELEKKYAAAQG
ncbi:MAG: hypothetical protein R6X08_13045 [Desulfosalsimonadaceae bacterium]